MQITRYQFDLYQKVRNHGSVNMMNVAEVGRLSGLTKEQIIYIIGNYGELKVKYAPINEYTAKVKVGELKEGKVYKGNSGTIRKIIYIKNKMVYYDSIPRNKRMKPKSGINTMPAFANWVREVI
jgi:hypothetical protein